MARAGPYTSGGAPRGGPAAGPRDTRARPVTLTGKGHEIVALSVPVVREIEATWEAHPGRDRTRELRRSLAALREITDPCAPAPDIAGSG